MSIFNSGDDVFVVTKHGKTVWRFGQYLDDETCVIEDLQFGLEVIVSPESLESVSPADAIENEA